jgi:hypothetical protein
VYMSTLKHSYTYTCIQTSSYLLISIYIGLNKLAERAKGINHPKYSVKPEYACFTHESARPASHLH